MVEGSKPEVIPVAQFRRNLASIVKDISGDPDAIRFVGSHRKPQFVLMSLERFKSHHPTGFVSMQEVQRKKGTVLRLAAHYGLSDVAVFGSVARSEEQVGSDLDILVQTKSGVSGFDLAGFELDLEALFGVKVDVVARNSLDPVRHADMLRDATEIRPDN
ncbi:MAG TPA: nucleotidyltransferase domain-containing protein [Aquiluna sp.]